MWAINGLTVLERLTRSHGNLGMGNLHNNFGTEPSGHTQETGGHQPTGVITDGRAVYGGMPSWMCSARDDLQNHAFELVENKYS